MAFWGEATQLKHWPAQAGSSPCQRDQQGWKRDQGPPNHLPLVPEFCLIGATRHRSSVRHWFFLSRSPRTPEGSSSQSQPVVPGTPEQQLTPEESLCLWAPLCPP